MKKRNLFSILLIRYVILVLSTVCVIGATSDILINSQLESYITQRQGLEADKIAQNISGHYDTVNNIWNVDYIHGLGMYALNEGYIIKIYDKN